MLFTNDGAGKVLGEVKTAAQIFRSETRMIKRYICTVRPMSLICVYWKSTPDFSYGEHNASSWNLFQILSKVSRNTWIFHHRYFLTILIMVTEQLYRREILCGCFPCLWLGHLLLLCKGEQNDAHCNSIVTP